MVNVKDQYTIELQIFLTEQLVVATENPNSLYELKVFNVQTRTGQLNLFSLPNEYSSASGNSLR